MANSLNGLFKRIPIDKGRIAYDIEEPDECFLIIDKYVVFFEKRRGDFLWVATEFIKDVVKFFARSLQNILPFLNSYIQSFSRGIDPYRFDLPKISKYLSPYFYRI